MNRVAWNIKLKQGMKAEYKKRHDEIWPEMIEVFNSVGIHNYTIWNSGCELFGYYEVENIDNCNRILGESPVIAKWNEYMKDVIEFKIDPDTVTVPAMELMFYHE